MFLDPNSNPFDILDHEFEQTPQQQPRPTNHADEANRPLVGEVVDSHHPELRGHLLIRWLSDRGVAHERWLKCVRGTVPQRGDRVLLEQPANWPEKLITAVIDSVSSGGAIDTRDDAGQRLALEPEQELRIVDKAGNPLLELYASSQGPVVRLLNENVDIEVAGKLRFKAATIELEAGSGGVDIRTDADTVVRSRYIRLN